MEAHHVPHMGMVSRGNGSDSWDPCPLARHTAQCADAQRPSTYLPDWPDGRQIAQVHTGRVGCGTLIAEPRGRQTRNQTHR